MLTPPLKYHGGKTNLARRIVELMPPHLHYVEPFAGGLAVLLYALAAALTSRLPSAHTDS